LVTTIVDFDLTAVRLSFDVELKSKIAVVTNALTTIELMKTCLSQQAVMASVEVAVVFRKQL